MADTKKITLESLNSIKSKLTLRKANSGKEFDATIYFPNGGTRSFGGNRNIPSVKVSQFIQMPAYYLRQFPDLQKNSNATKEQMEFISKQSAQSLINLYNGTSSK